MKALKLETVTDEVRASCFFFRGFVRLRADDWFDRNGVWLRKNLRKRGPLEVPRGPRGPAGSIIASYRGERESHCDLRLVVIFFNWALRCEQCGGRQPDSI